jgi:hypothetical protein
VNKAVEASMAFLQRWYSDSTRVLTAIHPEGYIRTRGFAAADEAAMRAFIDRWRGERGLYFAVNGDLRAPADIMAKCSKEHVGSVRALHLDLDTYKGEASREEALRRLKDDPPPGIPGPPSVLNDSGNGLQAFWLLHRPLAVEGALSTAPRRSSGTIAGWQWPTGAT